MDTGQSVSQKAIEDMSDWFAVASFYEARELRDQGITTPILVFGFLDDSNIEEASAEEYHLQCSILFICSAYCRAV